MLEHVNAEVLCTRCCWQEIATAILQEQTPKRLYEVRGKLYELLVNCLPPELILRKLTLELFRCAGAASSAAGVSWGTKVMRIALGYLGLLKTEHRVQGAKVVIRRLRAIVGVEYMLWRCDPSCMPLNRKLDDELRHKAIDLAALYEHRLQARTLPSTVALHTKCLKLHSCMQQYLLSMYAGGIQSHIPSGGVCCEVHERVQNVEHHDAGFIAACELWAVFEPMWCTFSTPWNQKCILKNS